MFQQQAEAAPQGDSPKHLKFGAMLREGGYVTSFQQQAEAAPRGDSPKHLKFGAMLREGG